MPLDNRKMIENPLLWPLPDYLCMKKPSRDGSPPAFGIIKTGNTRQIWAYPQDGGHLVEEFDNLDELLEAGWIVD